MAINWSGIDNHSICGKMLRLPLRTIPSATVVKIRRGPAKGLKWIVGSSTHGCWLGTYELEKQHALERFIRPGMTVYDIGANAGFYTLFFSRLSGPLGTVYAFEPFPYEVRYLLDHVRINDLTNVRVMQAAVGSSGDIQGFTIDRGCTTNMLCGDRDALFQVPTVALDELTCPPPDLIKMDVEGGESAILRGAESTLRGRRPIVFVALHGAEQKRACIGLLRNAGYRIYELAGVPVGGEPRTDEIYAVPEA